jgi:hypothetical protein
MNIEPIGHNTLHPNGLDHRGPCEDLTAYAWELVMSLGSGDPPVGILLVPSGASFDPAMSKRHCGHVHKNMSCLKVERRTLYHDDSPFPSPQFVKNIAERPSLYVILFSYQRPLTHGSSEWKMASQPFNGCITFTSFGFRSLPGLLTLPQAGFICTDKSTELRVINLSAILVIIERTFRIFLGQCLSPRRLS